MRRHPFAVLALASLLVAPADADDLLEDRGEYRPTFFAELQDVELVGSRAYVFGVGGLMIFDVAAPDAPVLLGRYAPPDDRANRLYRGAVSGDHAYGGGRQWGLIVVRLQPETNPTFVGRIGDAGIGYEGCAVDGGLLYACRHDAGLEILDLADPAAPTTIAEYPGLANAWDVAVRDGVAYVADGHGGLATLDVTDPTSPTLLASVPIPGAAASDVALDGDTAVVAAGSTGLVLFDVSDPADPAVLAVHDTSGLAATVAVGGGLAFVADWDDVEVLDIATPTRPEAAGLENTPVRAMGLAAADGLVYVADWSRLRIYAHGPTQQGDIEVPERFEFGPVEPGAVVDTVFTVGNTGGGLLTVHDIQVFDDAFEFVPPLGFTVPPGGSYDVPMRYTNDTLGADLTFMEITSDDTDESEVSLPVVGEPDPDQLDVGDPAPPFTLTDLDGVTHELSQYLGRVVVLAFFADW